MPTEKETGDLLDKQMLVLAARIVGLREDIADRQALLASLEKTYAAARAKFPPSEEATDAPPQTP